MMRQYELVERVLSYDPTADEGLLNRAYVYAMRAHGHQKRASGDPYFSHPLEVAAILTELKLDAATIATALLHDTIEDTGTTRAEIDQMFGPEIGHLVEGLTKIKKLDLVTKQAEQAENFRKLLIAISTDIRVLLVKLADRLHNMRTLDHMPGAKRARIAEETLEIYAPLAGRMGMQWLREELEELSFRWINPEGFATVTDKLADLHKKNEGLISEILKAIRDKLLSYGIEAEVSGREKKPYAIWRKMERKQISLEQLSDIYAFRVIVRKSEECYRVLGVVHTNWRSVPGRFKDYISNPKQNDYRSIHTTIVGPRHQRVELQIRTEIMHQIAEYGVAAHNLYKDQLEGEGGSPAYDWLRRLVDTLLEGDSSEEFLEHTKLELFQDQVFCFTPKGRLIALPRGATPIDFAYAVHTDVGNHCVGCRINGHHRPLTTELRNGDEVEIQTAEAQTPPAAWESIARTGKARSTIRRANKEQTRVKFGELGRQILQIGFRQRAQGLWRRDGAEGSRPSHPEVGRRRAGGGGQGRTQDHHGAEGCVPGRRAQARESARAPPAQPLREQAGRGLVQPDEGDGPQVPLAVTGGGDAGSRPGAANPDPWASRRIARRFRRGRRGAGRQDRRHRHARQRHPHLSDPFA